MKYPISRQDFSLSMAIPLLLLATTGCEEDLQKASVTGVVTMDGKPMDHGSISFVASGEASADTVPGKIRRDGTYTVQIGRSGKMHVGEYAVEITARGPSTPHPEGGPPTLGEIITPLHYGNYETSELRYNVRPGENVIDILLVSDRLGEELEGAETVMEPATNEASASKEDEQGSAKKPAEDSGEMEDAQPSTEETAAP